MSDILCQWINSELRLSKPVDPSSFARDFSSGYLIGKLLQKYQLQDDFDQFSKSSTANSRLNNFTRLEPTLQLLGVSFDLGMAQAVMQERQGAATRLLYQLYIVLQKKRRLGLTGTAMETLQPAATALLNRVENDIFTERLRTVVKREADVKLQKISHTFELRGQEMYRRSVMVQNESERKRQRIQEKMRLQDIEKHRLACRKQLEIMTRIQSAIVQIPKPPPNRTLKALERQRLYRKQQEAQDVYREIAQFEKNKKRLSPAVCGTFSYSALQELSHSEALSSKPSRTLGPNNVAALEQRAKRRRRFLADQLKAHKEQQERILEDQLVERLTRQTQQEKRLAVQLIQIQQQKEVLRQNRIFCERQYQEQQQRDFEEALDRDAALAQQAQREHAEDIRKQNELHDRIAAKRAEARYRKHFDFCTGVLEQIVDLATKAGEYRLLTGNLIPGKLMREWKELLFSGKPLYEGAAVEPVPADPTPDQLIEMEKLEILNNQDYDEYSRMTGEWAWPEEGQAKQPPPNNNILGHVVRRLRDITNPPASDPPLPTFARFTLKACVLGKTFSGKTACLAKIARAHGVYILSTGTLIQEAVHAFQIGEETADEAGKENKHGAAVEKILRKGQAIPDDLLVDIIVEAIRQVPAESGWILDGFPVNLTQAKLLEKALSGADPDKTDRQRDRRKSSLALDVNAPKEPPPPAPALDLALLLDVSDSLVLDRAAKQALEEESFGQVKEDTCPPDGEEPPIGQGAQDQSLPPRDKSLEKRQIQHRIMAFHDTWPKLEKWFSGRQNILVRVNAEAEDDVLFNRVEAVLQQVMVQRAEKGEDVVNDREKPACSTPPAPAALSRAPVLVPVPVAPPAPTESKPTITLEGPAPKCSRSKSNSRSPKGSRSRTASAKEGKGKTPETPEGKESQRRRSKSGSGGGHARSGRASMSSSSEDPRVEESAPSEGLLPAPANWVYVDEPLPKEIPEYLAPYWENVCSSYVANIKTVMQNLRTERNLIISHLYNIREDFKQYLKRPDHKQEFVSQWQQDYNAVPEDIRDDVETKAELHQRLDDLRERLWDICDRRREEAEQERTGVVGDGWLQDHTAVLVNHFSSLMQVEVDRFQDSLYVLRDYYKGMSGKGLPKARTEFVRIPLVDVTEEEGNQPDKIKSSERTVRSPGKGEDDEEEKKTRIFPLIPRRPPSAEAPAKELKESPAELSLDDGLVCNIWQTAMTAINNMVSVEVQQREGEETEEQLQERERIQRASQASATANSARDKKKASKKKGGPSPIQEPSTPPPVEEDFEEVQRKAVRAKIRQEYAAALDHEVYTVTLRLKLIKARALSVVQSLQRQTDQAYWEMEEWLGERFLAEMTSIDQLAEVARHHIELAAKIQHELVMAGTDFFLNGDIRVVPMPEPAPRPPPLEQPVGSTLTVLQLEAFYAQFHEVAPTGVMSSQKLAEILKLVSLDMGSNALPDPWMRLSEAQILDMISAVSPGSEVLHWRLFLLSAALPWPVPSQHQLLQVLVRFKAADPMETGFITEDQYLQTELWFPCEMNLSVPDDPSEPLPYSRLSYLRKFFFTLFADHEATAPRLDYMRMLLYFASHPDPIQGFVRALSVITEQPLQYYPSSSLLLKSVPYIEESASTETEEEPEITGAEEREGVSIPALLRVICHGGTWATESCHRFHPHRKSREEYEEDLKKIYTDLGFKAEEKIPFGILSQHPLLQELMDSTSQYQLTLLHISEVRGLAKTDDLHVRNQQSCMHTGHTLYALWDRLDMGSLVPVLFLLLEYPVLQQSAKILTVCLIGGSHYMLLDEISHTFHESGHDMHMLMQTGNPVIRGLDYVGRPNSYKIISWSASEAYIKEYNAWFLEQQKEFLLGRCG
ncbi:sperm flagellar protein 2 [Megalops cyprinoides]|uniref:sperm flagellar protein 2 n=1 Tax=Megalops cyprinoides TaxID=118141 RepID=UPI00186540AD|nr:sperm flagellar protein 2 [Megalops cyprinoides]